jgi:septal ring factor EnvC (AmiA/AmiB activator)
VPARPRRSTKKKEHTAPVAAGPPAGQAPAATEPAERLELSPESGDGKAADKGVSHPAHHRIIAQAVNHLIEAFNEFHKDTTAQLTTMKRQVKELEATLYKIQKQAEQQEQRLTEIDEDVMGLTLDSKLDVRRLKAQVDALWDVIAANAAFDADDVRLRREEVDAREDSRIDELGRELEAYAANGGGKPPAGGRA